MDVEQTLGSEWYLYLDPTQKELVKLSLQLYERENSNSTVMPITLCCFRYQSL